MAKIYVQRGDVITLTTGSGGAKSGDVFQLGSFIGVVAADAAAASDVEVCLTGVYDLPKAAEQISQGEAVYWDGAACTASDSGNTLIGAAVAGAATNDATIRVRLNGVAIVTS